MTAAAPATAAQIAVARELIGDLRIALDEFAAVGWPLIVMRASAAAVALQLDAALGQHLSQVAAPWGAYAIH